VDVSTVKEIEDNYIALIQDISRLLDEEDPMNICGPSGEYAAEANETTRLLIQNNVS